MRQLMRARGTVKKTAGAMRQPVFQPPGPKAAGFMRDILARWKSDPNRCGEDRLSCWMGEVFKQHSHANCWLTGN
eukprot:scaffold297988_cov15-Prasinocladus_malaysianus.AAC.2